MASHGLLPNLQQLVRLNYIASDIRRLPPGMHTLAYIIFNEAYIIIMRHTMRTAGSKKSNRVGPVMTVDISVCMWCVPTIRLWLHNSCG